MRNWLQQHFVPHENNDFKPHALQTAAMGGMMLLILLSFALANFQSVLWISSEWLVSTVLPAVVIDETNIARAEASLGALQHSNLLDEVAALKAADMAKNSYFAHWSPTGISPWYWFEQAGYSYSHAGENLAVHFTDSDKVVEAWLNSPTHRENIMNSNYTEIGIGTARGQFEGKDTVFVVQVFGSPAAVAPVENRASNLGEEVASDLPGEVAAAGEPTVAGVESDNQAEIETTMSDESVSITDEGTVVREIFAATEEPQMTEKSQSSLEQQTTYRFGKMLTSPRTILQIVYTIIGLFVLVVLIIATILEWRRHHPVQMAYSVGLLVVMIALFQLHLAVSNGILIA